MLDYAALMSHSSHVHAAPLRLVAGALLGSGIGTAQSNPRLQVVRDSEMRLLGIHH